MVLVASYSTPAAGLVCFFFLRGGRLQTARGTSSRDEGRVVDGVMLGVQPPAGGAAAGAGPCTDPHGCDLCAFPPGDAVPRGAAALAVFTLILLKCCQFWIFSIFSKNWQMQTSSQGSTFLQCFLRVRFVFVSAFSIQLCWRAAARSGMVRCSIKKFGRCRSLSAVSAPFLQDDIHFAEFQN